MKKLETLVKIVLEEETLGDIVWQSGMSATELLKEFAEALNWRLAAEVRRLRSQ